VVSNGIPGDGLLFSRRRRGHESLIESAISIRKKIKDSSRRLLRDA